MKFFFPDGSHQFRMVSIAGPFNGWNAQVNQLTYNTISRKWEVQLQLAVNEKIPFKFVIDGNDWRCSDDYKIEWDSSGNANNVVVLAPQPQEPAAQTPSSISQQKHATADPPAKKTSESNLAFKREESKTVAIESDKVEEKAVESPVTTDSSPTVSPVKTKPKEEIKQQLPLQTPTSNEEHPAIASAALTKNQNTVDTPVLSATLDDPVPESPIKSNLTSTPSPSPTSSRPSTSRQQESISTEDTTHIDLEAAPIVNKDTQPTSLTEQDNTSSHSLTVTIFSSIFWLIKFCFCCCFSSRDSDSKSSDKSSSPYITEETPMVGNSGDVQEIPVNYSTTDGPDSDNHDPSNATVT